MADYQVRLVMPITAPDATGAVDEFINRIVEHGLTRWIYHVTDEDGNLVAFANGDGVILDEDDLEPVDPAVQMDSDDENLAEHTRLTQERTAGILVDVQLPEVPDDSAPEPDTAATPEPDTAATPPESDDALLALADELNAEG